ncbi:DUF2516 family protein [Micrococcoides hystricis]|uniref:DUF2516 family protein n=1 Tax=Micrococcoides hystricis TaxID=1572761 RepID=A0ABV6PCD3_9MICC
MMNISGPFLLALQAEYWLNVLLSLVVMIMAVWAFVHAAKSHAQNFVVSGKRTKNFWLGLTGASAAVMLLMIFGAMLPFGMLFQLAAACVCGVYLAGVRPEVSGPKQTGYYGF